MDVGAALLEDLSEGRNEWVNIQPVVRHSFQAFYRLFVGQTAQLKRQQSEIELLKRQMRKNEDIARENQKDLARWKHEQEEDRKRYTREIIEIRGNLDERALLHEVAEALALKADRREMQYGLESKADRTELDGSVVRAQSLLGQVEDLRVEQAQLTKIARSLDEKVDSSKLTKAMAETVSQSRFTEYCVTADDKEAILTESMRASQKLSLEAIDTMSRRIQEVEECLKRSASKNDLEKRMTREEFLEWKDAVSNALHSARQLSNDTKSETQLLKSKQDDVEMKLESLADQLDAGLSALQNNVLEVERRQEQKIKQQQTKILQDSEVCLKSVVDREVGLERERMEAILENHHRTTTGITSQLQRLEAKCQSKIAESLSDIADFRLQLSSRPTFEEIEVIVEQKLDKEVLGDTRKHKESLELLSRQIDENAHRCSRLEDELQEEQKSHVDFVNRMTSDGEDIRKTIELKASSLNARIDECFEELNSLSATAELKEDINGVKTSMRRIETDLESSVMAKVNVIATNWMEQLSNVRKQLGCLAETVERKADARDVMTLLDAKASTSEIAVFITRENVIDLLENRAKGIENFVEDTFESLNNDISRLDGNATVLRKEMLETCRGLCQEADHQARRFSAVAAERVERKALDAIDEAVQGCRKCLMEALESRLLALQVEISTVPSREEIRNQLDLTKKECKEESSTESKRIDGRWEEMKVEVSHQLEGYAARTRGALAVLEGQLEDASSRLEETQNRSIRNEGRLAEQESKLQSMETSLKGTIDDITRGLAKKVEQKPFHRLQKEFTEMATNIHALQSDLSTLSEQVEMRPQSTDIDRLVESKADSHEVAKKLVSLEELVREFENRIEDSLSDFGDRLSLKANIYDIREWMELNRKDMERMVGSLKSSLRAIEVMKGKEMK